MVLSVSASGKALDLIRSNVRSGERERVGHTSVVPSLSPDGRWLICDCRAVGAVQPMLKLMQYDDSLIQRRSLYFYGEIHYERCA